MSEEPERSVQRARAGQTSPEEYWRVAFKYVDRDSVLIAYRLECDNFYRNSFHERLTNPHIAELLVKHELRKQPTVQTTASMRGLTGPQGSTGKSGAAGEQGVAGPPGPAGPSTSGNDLTAEEVRRWRAQIG